MPSWFPRVLARLLGRAVARRAPAVAATVLLALSGVVAPAVSHADDAQASDPRLFVQTGYRIDRDAFWDYFTHRGGTTTFGYPVSRDFQFMGCPTQFFQRLVLQQCGSQGVSSLNLLDDGLLPYTRINGSTFPAPDSAIKAATPPVTDPNYATKILEYTSAVAPDTFDGQPVNFRKTFFNTISPDLAGTDDPYTLGLLDLEIWGAPTSAPAYDPTNHDFIYQRFQRGIMHYNKGCGCTQGLLLADYLKAVLTGQNLPPDLAQEAVSSPLLRAAVSSQGLPGSSFANAFVPGAGLATASASPTPTSVAANPPYPVPSPDFGLSMFLWDEPNTTARDLGIANSLSFHWQKTLFKWREIEGAGKGKFDWTEADRVVKASAQAGIKIIARLDFQPDWARADHAHNGPPDNYQDYADFVSAFVSRYKPGSPYGTVDAIEVWNEVNLTREWGDQPINQQQAADYVRLLSLAYRAAHAANPSITVLTAGLSPTGVESTSAWDDAEYLKWLFAAGLKGGVNYDALGAHGNTQAPVVDAALGSLPGFGHPSFYFRRIEQLRQVQLQAGDSDRQIWLLEFGWTADPIHPQYSWFAVTEDQKAANDVAAFKYAEQNWRPWIGVMTLWTLADPTWTSADEEYWWAIDNPDGTPRAALNAIKTARASGAI